MSQFLLDLVGDASPSAFLFTEDFENGTNSATITTANSGFTSTYVEAGVSATFSNALAVNGGMSARFTTSSGFNSSYFTKKLETSGDYYVRLWLYLPALPVGDVLPFLSLDNSGGGAANSRVHRLEISTTGLIRSVMAQSGSLANTSAMSLSPATWYRIELNAGPNAGNTIKIYSAAGALLESMNDGFAWGKNYDQLEVGLLYDTALQTPFTAYIDGVAASPQPLPINFDAGTFTESASVQILVNAVSASDSASFSDSGVADPQNVYSLSFTNGPDGSTYSRTGQDTLVYAADSGASITYNAGNAFDGSYGGKVASPGSAGVTLKATANQNGNTHYARMYVRFPGLPSTSTKFAQAFDTPANDNELGSLRLNTLGKIELLSAGIVVATSTTVVASAGNQTWWRVEWDQVGTTQTVRLYKGSSSTATETLSGSLAGTAMDHVFYGNPNGIGYTYYIDEIAGNSGRTPGPVAGGVLFVEDFENGTNGTALTTSNSSVGTASGTNTIAAFSSTQKYTGSLSWKKTNGATLAYGIWALPSTTFTLYSRFYFYVETVPSTGVTVIAAVDNGSGTATNSLAFNLAADSSHWQLRLTGFNQGTVASSTFFNINTWYRIEWDIVSNTSMRARVYLGESSIPIETLVQAPYNTSGFSNFNIADRNSSTVAGQTLSAYWDAVKVSGTQQPGAIAPATSASETGTFSEAASAVQVVSASDTGSGTDAVAARSATLTASETASAVDSGAAIFPLSDGDTATAVDARSALTVARPDNETLSVVDAGGVTARGGNFFDSDTALFTESASIARPQTASDTAIAGESQSLAARASTSDNVQVKERADIAKSTWRFLPPAQHLRYPIRGSLIVTIDEGLTVLKKNGTYRIVSAPLAEDVEAADVAYLGGRAYAVDDAEIAALSAAGYGAYVALMPEPS